MGTTQNDIRSWIERGKAQGAMHVIVVCDTFSYEDYPVFVMPGTDARKKSEEYNDRNMRRLMEVYDLSLDIDEQIAERRAFHY